MSDERKVAGVMPSGKRARVVVQLPLKLVIEVRRRAEVAHRPLTTEIELLLERGLKASV